MYLFVFEKQTQTKVALLSQIVIESMRLFSSNRRPSSINRSVDNLRGDKMTVLMTFADG